MSEQDLVNAIIQYIQVRGGVAIRINSGMRIVSGENQANYAFRGAPKGTPDIIACLPGGKFAAIECKVGKNRPSFEQQMAIDEINETGGLAFVTWDLETAINKIQKIIGE